MTKNKSIKLCRICGEYYKTCGECADVVRNDSDWYNSEAKIQKVRNVKNNGGRKDTFVNQLYDRELRHEYVDQGVVSRRIFLVFLFVVVAITYFLFYV